LDDVLAFVLSIVSSVQKVVVFVVGEVGKEKQVAK